MYIIFIYIYCIIFPVTLYYIMFAFILYYIMLNYILCYVELHIIYFILYICFYNLLYIINYILCFIHHILYIIFCSSYVSIIHSIKYIHPRTFQGVFFKHQPTHSTKNAWGVGHGPMFTGSTRDFQRGLRFGYFGRKRFTELSSIAL